MFNVIYVVWVGAILILAVLGGGGTGVEIFYVILYLILLELIKYVFYH